MDGYSWGGDGCCRDGEDRNDDCWGMKKVYILIQYLMMPC